MLAKISRGVLKLSKSGFQRAQTKILATYPETEALYLFGSLSDGSEGMESDVDLAILLPPPASKEVSGDEFLNLKTDLEEILFRKVDLINLRTVSAVFKKEIVFKGKRVFTGDERAAAEFEMLTLSFYQKLNEERREILKDFNKTGKAYDV